MEYILCSRHCAKYFTSLNFCPHLEVGTITITIVQMRKLNLREGKYLPKATILIKGGI